MYVILEKNYVGYEDGYSLMGIYGPFDYRSAAQELADKYNANAPYGTKFYVQSVESPDALDRQMQAFYGEK